jgi:NAD-dependent deacetylase
MAKLELEPDRRLLVLTGAGVSAESGVPTFRGAGGLWENHPFEKLASPEGFRSDPGLVGRFYSDRRVRATEVHPNPGHRALAAAEQRLGDRMLLVTQNVDGLHRRAGSTRLLEIHGNLFRTRCSGCDLPAFEDAQRYRPESLPKCQRCRGLLRPDIVWFGEHLDPAHLERVDAFIEEAGSRLIFLAAGTSGAVWPAAGMVDLARGAGGKTWLVNLEEPDNASRFHHVLTGKSGELLPELLGGQS